MDYDFGIRVDVGDNIGSGHFFRCYSIAKNLKKVGLKVVFVVNNEKSIKEHLGKVKIPYIVLKSKNENDRIKKCEVLSEKIEVFLIDLPFKNEQYSKNLKNKCKTIIIDDIGNKKIRSQLLFNGHVVDKFQKYDINEKITKYFFGPKYMILRNEFETIRRRKIVPRGKICKILLTFGGSDDSNLSTKISSYFISRSYNVTIVLGPSYSNQKKLNKIIQKNKNFQLIKNEKNMAKLFSKHDLVISSSGITAYELACLGIPCILIPSDKYQEKTAIALAKKGFGMNYGFWDDDLDRFEQIISSMTNQLIRKKMYVAGRKLVDGKGTSRIIKQIIKLIK
jgi:UDP-2,4-diacetamido-2,4,6-trideoxy-beta-L-altropyranose hydrolase